ncbi:HNH endonuclease [Tomitella gaofuii]|uniref:HNH endonuclease n=1 Tax=Tomitella gaofuii TaxID=2760083 RepID=UPI0035585FC3
MQSRSGGRCERCGMAEACQVHHRKPRRMGGTRDPRINAPSNLLHLCYYCHSDVESKRALAIDQGHVLSSWHIPVETECQYRGRWVRLTDDGNVERCRGSELTTGSPVAVKY